MPEQIDITAQADQAGAMLHTLSGPVGEHYRALIGEGLPKDLAGKIVRDTFWMILHRGFWPDQPPQTMPE